MLNHIGSSTVDAQPPWSGPDDVPPSMTAKWQSLINLLAELLDVPVALVMKAENAYLEVSVSSNTQDNPYRPGSKEHWEGLYCQTVIQQQRKLVVANALKDPQWTNNPDGKLGMIAYMGVPVNFPDGRPFGTICVLDRKERHFTERESRVLQSVQHAVQSDLAALALQLENDRQRDALRESREIYRTLVRYAADLIWVMNRDGEFSFVSPSFKTMLGYDADSLLGKACRLYVHPDDIPAIDEYVQRVLTAGASLPGPEYRVKHTDGDWYWHEVRLTPVFDEDGSLKHYVGISRDITLRRRAEEELRQREQFIRAVLDHLPVGVTVNSIDQNEPPAYMNDLFPKCYRTTREALTSVEAFWKAVYPDLEVRQRMRDRVEADCASGDPERMYWQDIPLVREQGTTYVTARNAPIPGTDQMISLVWDVTDRKQAEQKLEAQYHLLRVAGDIANLGGWRVDLGANQIIWSDAVADIHDMPRGYSPPIEEGISFYAPEHRDRITEVYTACVEQGTPYDEEMQIITRAGKRVWARTVGEAVRDKEGRIVQVRGAFQDITQQQTLEEQLRRAQKMEAIGRLAGGVAHDFNNFAMAVMGYVELACESLSPDHPSREDLEEAIKVTRRSVDLTRQLLAFARKQTVSPRVLDINEMVSGTLKLLQRLLGEDIDIAWMPCRDLAQVRMDPAQLDQILANLCVNARDAMADSGRLTIQTKKARIDDAYCQRLADAAPGDYVLLIVEDTGSGMSAETIQHVFEPFFTTKGVGLGTGLGLATVYGIVKQNNGFIDVQSEVGKGTRFRLYIPEAKEEPMDAAHQVSENQVPDGGTETLFLVEDEPAILRVLERRLESMGYTVLACATPEEALKRAESHAGAIPLLITDVIMPGMSGRELSERLQKRYPRIKTLFMSGYTASVIEHHGMLDEGVEFLQKPVTVSVIAAKIRSLLDAD